MAFAPELGGGSIREGLPQLPILAGLIVAFGIVYVVDGFTRALFGTVSGAVGWIPFVGKVVSAPIETIAQKVSNAMGAAEDKIDSAIGVSFHKLASSLILTAELLIAIPVLLLDVARLLAQHALGITGLRNAANVAKGAASTVDAAATHGLDRVRAAEAGAIHGIDTLSGRIGIIEGEIADTFTPELEAMRARTRQLEDGYQRAWDLLRKHEEALGIGAVTGAVAVALESLGGGWIRCETNKLIGRKLCGSSFGLLKALIEGALGVFTIAELCNLSKLLVKVAQSGPVQESLTAVTVGLGDLFRCQGVSRADPYKLAAATLAPAQGYAALNAPSV